MRGILWRWLFFFGTIFWISLCLADYHQKYLQMNLKQTLKNMEFSIDPPAPPYYQIVPQKRKLQPPTPALTFWKFLSIVFSVSAIVIIKRISTFRKKNLPVTSCSDFDLIRSPYNSFITRVPPIINHQYEMPIYHQEFQVARFETNMNSGDSKPPALLGVKIVQKKLEDLENNIATLKQRINNNSATSPANLASDSLKKAYEEKFAENQNYFGPLITNSDTHSSIYSSSLNSSEIKTRKEILHNHSRPATPVSFDLTFDSNDINAIPGTSSTAKLPSKSNSENKSTLSKLGKSGNSSTKEVKFKQTTYEYGDDMISLKDLKDSMSEKILNYETRKISSMNLEDPFEQDKDDLSQEDLKSSPVSLDGFNFSSKHTSKRSLSKKSRKESKYQLSEIKMYPESNSTTLPSISSHKSNDGSNKSFQIDKNSSTKLFTDSNSTNSTLTSIRKRRLLKSIKERKKEFKNIHPISTSIAAYFAPNIQSAPFPQRHKHSHGSYAAINRKKAHTMQELRANTSKLTGYDQMSMSSSNDSSDSIDKFVAKMLKPESDAMLMKNSSDDMSMASTSISSLTASSSTFISGISPKFDSITNSIRSILPLSRTTVSSKFSSIDNLRNMPAGAEPLSSGESIVEKSVSALGTNVAIHSLAMNYLQTLEREKTESDSQEKIPDSGSEFSFSTKSVLDKYKSKTKDCSVASSHQNILEDKYWLLHW